MKARVAGWCDQKHANFSIADVEQNILAPSSLCFHSTTTKAFIAQS